MTTTTVQNALWRGQSLGLVVRNNVGAEGRSDSQLIFCSEPVQPGGAGATSKDIRKALRKLKDDGQSATEGLYVFFSGHGFPWGPGGKPVLQEGYRLAKGLCRARGFPEIRVLQVL
jgi:hypothetical protein